MKKKNIIKKLLSVVLSAATVFSLLTLPAHALVPGEDAVTDSPNIVWHDLNTGVITPMDIEGEYVFAFNEVIDSDFSDYMSPQQIIPPDSREPVDPADDPYSGILLITQFIDNNGDSIVDEFAIGTGFMLTERIMMTAMHCISPKLDGEEAYTMQTRVYQGVSLDIEELIGKPVSQHSALEFKNKLEQLVDDHYLSPVEISILEYDANYFYSDNVKYDWCIAVLDSELDCYTFQIQDTIIGEMTAELTGYPEDHMFGMYKATGSIMGVTVYGEVYHNIDAYDGQSGSPIYAPTTATNSFPYIVYAIHTGNLNNDQTINRACPITDIIIQAKLRAEAEVE